MVDCFCYMHSRFIHKYSNSILKKSLMSLDNTNNVDSVDLTQESLTFSSESITTKEEKMPSKSKRLFFSKKTDIQHPELVQEEIPMATNVFEMSINTEPTLPDTDFSVKPQIELAKNNEQSGEEDELNLENKVIISMNELRQRKMPEILKMAEEYEIGNVNRMLKQDIVCAILRKASGRGEVIVGKGVLEIVPEGFGFLRGMDNNYVPSPDDIYISQNQIKKFGLRTGDEISGYIRDPKKTERYFSILKIIDLNGGDIGGQRNKINFDNLTPLYPKEKLNFDIGFGAKETDVSTRVIDLVAPIGKGQRAIIVAPPRTGKTVLMHNIAHAIEKNHPEVHLIALLIDERPEEVTDMTRSIKGEVVSSTFDEPATRHVALAEIVVAKAKRLVENGKDVVILLDSITRLARAYNTVVPSSGKVLTGGVDANALQRPKRFFGAARNTEEAGSLTIISTALVETGSKMDEVIFEEFKGTGNSEIVLDRKAADRRLFPAIDVVKSGTRKEEEMMDSESLSKRWMLRRLIAQMGGQMSGSSDALEFLLVKVKSTKDNVEFFAKMNQ